MRWMQKVLLVGIVLLAVMLFSSRAAADEGGPTAKYATTVIGSHQPLPAFSRDVVVSEGFEGGIVPPTGWDLLQTNPNETWTLFTSEPHSGMYAAHILYDPALIDQDEILLSPSFTTFSGYVDLWSMGSPYWCRDDYDNCDLEVWFVKGTWGGGDDTLLGLTDGDWPDAWIWSESTFDFSSYADGTPSRIAIRYVGNDGAEVAVDDITIDVVPITCSDPYEPNDSQIDATPMVYGDTLSDPDICPAGDLDFYAFSGSAGDVIIADIDAQSLTPASSLDSVLYLLDSGGSELAYNDDDAGFDSRIAYQLPADGTYFLMVRDFGHPDVGGPDYFYTLSLARATSFDLQANWASGPPSVDGYITSGEWSSAASYDITNMATAVRWGGGELILGPVEQPESSAASASRAPVTLYVMNDETNLYLAFDNPNDVQLDDYDQVGIYFDDNPLPSDGQWTNSTCGNPDGEGNYWVVSTTHYLREIVAGPTYCSLISPAPGVDGILQFTSGHAQAEVVIDLSTSALRAIPGDTIGMYMWIMDEATGIHNGEWPLGAMWNDPATYRSLTLAEDDEEAAWTFLVYLDGDNNLEGAGIDDFLEMSSVGASDDVNIVVQFDRIPGYESSYGDWTSTKRFLVTPGMTPAPEYAVQDVGEANMGDPQTLIDFVQWGMTNYPAERYALVMWDHGSGWRLRSELAPIVKDIAFDNTSGGDAIDMPELRSALDILTNSGANPIDLVGFDACLMGMVEVDVQLIPFAGVRVGSEDVEPLDGWDYDSTLSALVADPTMSASDLGTVIVDDYYASYWNDQTQSSVDLGSVYGNFVSSVDNFAAALMSAIPTYCPDIAIARGGTQEFEVWTYVDIYDFAYQINQRISDTTINAAANDLMTAVDNAVLHERHGSSWPGAHGISIYYPEFESGYDYTYDGSYGTLAFTADTQWDEFLQAFYDCPTTCNDPHEPNDARADATPMMYGDTIDDADICPQGDLDFYVFSGSAGDVIIADIDARSLSPVSSLDSYLYLLDGHGNVLSYNDDSDGYDSRIVYTLPADGQYFLRVEEYSHPNEGGLDYFYTLSLLLQESSELDANWTETAPTVDGYLTSGEWSSAASYDITNVEVVARLEDGATQLDVTELPQSVQSRAARAPVTLYVMNDGTHLYLAFDNPNDTIYNDYDQAGIYFDDNPLPSDGQWTNTTCGHADGEGNFWVEAIVNKYREIVAGPDYCTPVSAPPGLDAALQFTSGHAQIEVAIDLTNSALRATPGESVGMYMWIYDYDSGIMNGVWPMSTQWNDPATYLPLNLADDIALPDIAVSPASFDVTLQPDQSAQRTMTIYNQGQGTLSFDIHDEETTLRHVMQGPTLPMFVDGVVNARGELLDVANGSLSSSELDGVRAISLDILYYGDSSEPEHFAALGASVFTTTNPASITEAYLNQFDVFFIGYAAERDYGNLSGQATAIQNYIAGGGGVILEQPTVSGYQSQFLPPGFEVTVVDALWLGYPSLEPMEFTSAGYAHPMLQGLTPDDLSGNFDTVYDADLGSSYIRLARLMTDTNVIALAAGEYGNGRIVFQTGNMGLNSADPGSDLYIEQMLVWAASGDDLDARWLSEAPSSGTVAGEDSEDIVVTFDASGLSIGTYTADIVIASNDPNEDPFIVPATLHVSDANPVIVTIEDGVGSPGSFDNPVTISADNQSLNPTAIAAGEFRVLYDGTGGLSLADVDTTARTADFMVGWALDASVPSASEAHILLYNLDGETVSPGTGPILELLFDVDVGASAGDIVALSFSDVALADLPGNAIDVEFDDLGQFIIGCSKNGDINADGSTDILDLQILINMIMHNPQPDPSLYPLDWWCRADLAPHPNGDDQWNVFDLQRLVCLILGTCEPLRDEGLRAVSENFVGIGDVYAHPGTSGSFGINCDNEESISAVELWFTYDSTIGVNITDVTTNTRTDQWSVAFSKDESDASAVEVHVLLYNLGGGLIAPATDAILSVLYDVATDASGDSPLAVSQVNLADSLGEPLRAKFEGGVLHITSDNPVPTLAELSPSAVLVGGGTFTMTVNGTGFVPDAVVRWNGMDLNTHFVSSSQLQAGVPSGYVATAGMVSVTVFNPTPGGGLSGALTFAINNPAPILTDLSPRSTIVGINPFDMVVTGTNFIENSVVRWDNEALVTTFVSGSRLIAEVTGAQIAAEGTFSITVLNPSPGGGLSAVIPFFVTLLGPEEYFLVYLPLVIR